MNATFPIGHPTATDTNLYVRIINETATGLATDTLS